MAGDPAPDYQQLKALEETDGEFIQDWNAHDWECAIGPDVEPSDEFIEGFIDGALGVWKEHKPTEE